MVLELKEEVWAGDTDLALIRMKRVVATMGLPEGVQGCVQHEQRRLRGNGQRGMRGNRNKWCSEVRQEETARKRK